MKPGRPKHRSVRPRFISVELDDKIVFYKLDEKGQVKAGTNSRRLEPDHTRAIESTPAMISSPVVIPLAGLDSSFDMAPDLSVFEPGFGTQQADTDSWAMHSDFFGPI